MIDEMDLVNELKTAEPLRPQAFDEARVVLRAAMAADEGLPETKTAARRRARWGTRRTVGFGAAAVATAAAAVVALVLTSAPAASHHATAHSQAAPGRTAPKTAPTTNNPILTQLAGNISVEQVKLPGNATLEIRNQSATSGAIGDNGIDVYTDNGTYYWGYNQANLIQVIGQGQDVAGGEFQRDVAVALSAVNGNLATVRAKMSTANYAGGKPPTSAQLSQAQQTEIQKLKAIDKEKHIAYTPPKPLTPAQKAEQTDNLIWMNSTDALIAAPDNAQVRAGVLRILATMPHVTVAHTTTAGQATLTLSDSWPLLAGGGTETLTINATTGLPIASSDYGPGQPTAMTYYHTSRVTLANVEAGKL